MRAILLAHAVAALLAPLVVRRLGRNGFFPLAIVPLAGLGWVIDKWGTVETLHITWVPGLSMDIDFRFDALSAIMAVLVLAMNPLASSAPGMIAAGTAILILSNAMLVMAGALKIFATMSWEEMGKGLAAVAGCD